MIADASILQSWLGQAFAVAVSAPAPVDDQLFPEERTYIAGAVRRRREEFGTARVCARRALAALGVQDASLVPYADRSPRWPKGIVGSLSHCQDLCVAAVTAAPHIHGFGIDVEIDVPLDQELETMICTAGERNFVSSRSTSERGRIGKMIFCAKEAVYKCQYPLTKTFLDFQDIELELDSSLKTFVVARAPRHREIEPLLRSVKGRFLLTHALIFTTATLVGD
ncbi:4'-phosphopantetheinyl transferase [Rhizobium rhizogenes]|uniref:4'-phosphopantetheinyl transferase family protein n=1 Tax=Rhizobium rhizogenes TaxID=359 RepID=UPI00226FCC95|nr:4'-phosphopantetheinyl transferase superfamily protein [Rhizobium rhizogenes]